jgi:serralysin
MCRYGTAALENGMLSTASVAPTGNILIDALTWGQKWTSVGAPLQIKVGVKTAGGLLPTLAESNAIQSVLVEFERVINVDFIYVGVDNFGTSDLTFKIYNDATENRYGWSVPAGEQRVAGFGDVNILRDNYADPTGALGKGSFDYITFVHEFAHAMGLAHPHDYGGNSDIFPGVTSPTSMGYFGLNQGVYTTMSSNDGLTAQSHNGAVSFWNKDVGSGQSQTGSSSLNMAEPVAFGFQSGLMALDILALQNLYGSNTSYNAGNNAYALPTVNAVGTTYVSLWDTGGIDSIFMSGSSDSVIDLRAATGLVAEGGGGFVSSADYISGGFTIAAGVEIENAYGANGNDVLIGNSADNRIEGGAGHDILTGLGGKDVLVGGAGNDRFVFTSEFDSGLISPSADIIQDFSVLDDLIDFIGIDANTGLAGNQAFSFIGFASSFNAASQVRAAYNSGNTVLYLNTDADMSTETVVVLQGLIALTADDFLL